MNIPKAVSYIIGQLEQKGHEAYAVGGCVRDALLGRVPSDWDITTSARPEEVKKIFRRTVDTGIAHGTVTVMVEREGYEVTTYRVDGKYEDHRHPDKVEFTPNLEEDLKRRDFTINAMAYNDKDGIVDLFHGRKHLREKRIVAVGNPKERFDEDALRMLRAVRFSGQLGFAVDGATTKAMKEIAPTIEHVSAERIRVELSKLLVSPHPEKILDAVEAGLTKVILPELDQMLHTKQNNPNHIYDVGNHCIHTVIFMNEMASEYNINERDKIMLSFAALLHDADKPSTHVRDEEGVDHFPDHSQSGSQLARKILRRLRFDNYTVDMVTKIILCHENRHDQGMEGMRRLLNKIGKDAVPFLLMLQRADVLAQSEWHQKDKLDKLDEAYDRYRKVIGEGQAVVVNDLAISGRDLIAKGVKPGRRLGELLDLCLENVLVTPEHNEREYLLELCNSIEKWDE